MKFEIIPVTGFMQNCTLIWCEETNQAAFIDPGGDVDVLMAAVESKSLNLTKILLTHGHIDHAGGAEEIKRRTNVDIVGPHIADKFWLDQLESQSKMLNIPNGEVTTPDQWLENGNSVVLGNLEFQVLHTPGHTPGHVCFYLESEKCIWVGDVLFKGSIGRTDFPQSSFEELEKSCKEVLFKLSEDTVFYPGHGPESTIGEEKHFNPFVGEFA